jgi:hypothetical protein
MDQAMTDLVARLRETGSDLADDAADEIERLRDALATCRELREGDKIEIANLRAAYVSTSKP